MKKGLKLFLLSSFAIAGLVSVVNSAPATGTGLVEETVDVNNNLGVDLKKATSKLSEVFVSDTKVQLGQVDGVQYLRFVTVVSGPIKSITYTRATSNETLGVRTYEVKTVYKGIEAAGETLYYDGTDFVTTQSEATNDYYFACYVIKFETNTYKNEAITAYATVTSLNSDAETITSTEKVTTLNSIVENQSVQYIYSAYDIERLNKSIAAGVDFSTKTVKLMADLELGTVSSIVLDVKSDLTLDLNGHSIVASTDKSSLYLVKVSNGAHLTINDSSEEKDGLLSFRLNGVASGYSHDNYTIMLFNNYSYLTLNGGTVENLSEGEVIASAIDIDNYYEAEAKVVINGGKVSCPAQYGIRMRLNGTVAEKPNYLEINGGLIEGRRAVWIQNTNYYHNTAKLIVNGGTFNGTQSKIHVSTSASCSIEDCDVKHIEIQLNDGVHTYEDIYFASEVIENHTTVKVAAKVETTEEFKTALTAGKNIVLTENVALEETNIAVPANEEVTINFKGSELSATSTVAGTDALFNVSANATLNLVGEGKIVYDAESPDTSSNPRYASNAISNRGTLLVDGVDIINKSTGSASYCIDNYEGANLTINSGNFINEGKSDAIRVFRYGATFENNIVINGGYFEGRIPLFIQLAGSDAAVAPEVNVTINGGTFVTTDETYYTAVYFLSSGFNYDNVSFILNGGSFNGYIFVNTGSNSGTMTCEFNGGTFTSGFGVYCYQTYTYLYR